MPAFIPYLIYAAGAAALAHFGSGCNEASEENSPPLEQSPAGKTKTQATPNATPAQASNEKKVENQQEENPESSYVPYSLYMEEYDGHDNHYAPNLAGGVPTPPDFKFFDPLAPNDNSNPPGSLFGQVSRFRNFNSLASSEIGWLAEPSGTSPSEPINDDTPVTGPPVTCALELYWASSTSERPDLVDLTVDKPGLYLLLGVTNDHYGNTPTFWSWGCYTSE